MTTLIEIVHGPTHHTERTSRTVDVAGVAWPVYKLYAVIGGLLAGLGALLITDSGQITMWVTAVAVLTVWWGGRMLAPALRATSPGTPPSLHG
jgi:hypothetical protein